MTQSIRRIFLCSGTGNGKSTLLKKIEELGTTTCNPNTSAYAVRNLKSDATFNDRQTALIQNIWSHQCTTVVNRNDENPKSRIQVYDRSVMDFLDGSRRSNDLQARSAAKGRVRGALAHRTDEHWENTVWLLAPTLPRAMMNNKQAKDSLLGDAKRRDYWTRTYLQVKGSVVPSETILLDFIHEQMVISRTWIKSTLEAIQYTMMNSSKLVILDPEDSPVKQIGRDFFDWQDIALTQLSPFISDF